ncbi:mRNA interferase RelE/StbE [Cyclonatronum proteinivorum]|uniref:mRNA interferase RelE/StbE n=1 Tax=Cyclonatronum proteinivorum TaxID=1457365 RepID=A0A345UG11_9BACT|nr:type II toxin-antitoxin system RelE/ParE family toxin [Cyclonatronum proteinivorum]AXI99412.1 mRNA interferase RelE/StbE [Cyclonatronum proteinivorum]
MTWRVEFDNRARKELRKLDVATQDRILKWMRDNLSTDNDPQRMGSSLKGRMKGLWRYRVNDYRIICQIQDDKVLILVVRIGHRRDIYDKK